MSSLCTAAVVWLILIAYVIGLSIGVHLLSLLALAAGSQRARATELLDTTFQSAAQSLSYLATRPDASLFDFYQHLDLLQIQNVYRAAAQTGDTVRAQRALAVLQPYLREQR